MSNRLKIILPFAGIALLAGVTGFVARHINSEIRGDFGQLSHASIIKPKAADDMRDSLLHIRLHAADADAGAPTPAAVTAIAGEMAKLESGLVLYRETARIGLGLAEEEGKADEIGAAREELALVDRLESELGGIRAAAQAVAASGNADALARLAAEERHRPLTQSLDALAQLARDQLNEELTDVEESLATADTIYLVATLAVLLASGLVALHTSRTLGRLISNLGETSALLEAMLANSPDLIYFKDRDSRLVRFSHSFFLRFNLPDPEALRGKTDFELYTGEHAQIALADEQTILRTGQPIVDKLERETHADGRVTWVLTTKMPWRNDAGRIIGTFGLSKDVSALKETEAKLAYERDQLRSLLDASPDSIYFKDRDSRFVLLSQSKAQKMLERTPGLRERLSGPDTDSAAPVPPDRFVGLSDADVYAGDHAAEALADEEAILRTGEPLIGRTEKQLFRDGSTGWALTNKMPWRDKDGQIIGTFGVSKDITELKSAEEKLELLHRQLLGTSRAAGMAEVATGVLHNVGNVLNSVNVSATLVADTARRSKAGNLGKLSTLLTEHAADLGTFLRTDPRGRMVQPYLATLAEDLAREQASMITELDHLRKNVDHIKDIVAMQQNYAKTSGVIEAISIPDLIEDAIHMNAGSLARHGIDITRDYQARPVVALDKHKVLQVLVNLIRNAKYACDESGHSDKCITLRLTADTDTVSIAVVDNGVGIPAENLTRIFNHGFTTRAAGHGFGLHSGALAAKEMGGSLLPASDGPGRGATFTLTLPFKPAHSPHD